MGFQDSWWNISYVKFGDSFLLVFELSCTSQTTFTRLVRLAFLPLPHDPYVDMEMSVVDRSER